jgi:hypothetical protein
MNDELAARQRAVSLRLAGRPVKQICSVLGRGETCDERQLGFPSVLPHQEMLPKIAPLGGRRNAIAYP